MGVKRVTLFICLFVYSLIGLFPQPVAAVMESNNYSVEKQSVKIQPFQQPQPEKPSQEAEKPYAQGENYIVQTTATTPFSFSISDTSIDFGKLSATNPVIRKILLTTTSSRGYEIISAANHPLSLNTTQSIPDTTCDNGACSEVTPALWTNPLTYGFGYRIDRMEKDFFKQIPDTSRNEAFFPLITGTKTNLDETSVLYKVNIAGSQEEGAYKNVITIIATPDF